MVDRNGVPLSCRVSAANRPDVCPLLRAVVSCPLTRYGDAGRFPAELHADRAYDSHDHEAVLRGMEIEPVFARRGEPHGSGLGKVRHVVERALAAVHQNRRQKVRYERRADIHQAFLTLACIKICWYRLRPKPK